MGWDKHRPTLKINENMFGRLAGQKNRILNRGIRGLRGWDLKLKTWMQTTEYPEYTERKKRLAAVEPQSRDRRGGDRRSAGQLPRESTEIARGNLTQVVEPQMTGAN